jgi:hypothetical protein
VPVNEKVSGVPAYVSPEQAQGKPVDQRSNTYSLACIFYHLLTGEPPFTAATPQAVLDLHVSSPPLPPSQRRPGATLSPDVDRVLLKALDKNSSRRHLTLRLFLTEVEALTLASAPAPGAPASKDVGFAKTMLFAGGQQEVANLVAKAIAARTGGTAPMAAAAAAPRTTPASMAAAGELNAAPARAPTPAPVVAAPAPAHVPTPAPAAVANTVMAASGYAPEPGPPTAQSRLTPPPVTPVPPEALRAGAAAGADKNDGKGGAFRETLWFKKGDVDQMVAEAKAKLAAQGKLNPDGTPIEAPEDVRPLEDRYVDDGTVTAEDRKKFSLRTGGTTAMPRASAHVPGEDMSESDVMQEMAGTRKTMILVVAGVLVAALLVVVIMMMRGKGSSHSSAPTPSPTLAAPAAAAPAPPPPPAPAAAPRPEPKPAAVAKRDPEAGGAARDGAKKRASRKKSKHRR